MRDDTFVLNPKFGQPGGILCVGGPIDGQFLIPQQLPWHGARLEVKTELALHEYAFDAAGFRWAYDPEFKAKLITR